MRIYFRLRRSRCKQCRKTAQQPVTGLDPVHASTARLTRYIEQESLSIFRTFRGLANETGISDRTIRDISSAHIIELQKNRIIETLRWIAIDEAHLKKGKVCCVFTDPVHRQVLDLLPNSPVALKKWLLQLPNRLESPEVLTIDMDVGYRSAIRQLLPNAKIIVDRYHVHNLLSVALQQVMEVLRESMTYSEQRKYMRREELLLKNYRRLSKERKKGNDGRERPSEQDLVQRWLADVPDLATAYWLARDFSDILQLTNRQKGEELTDLWLARACQFVEDFRAKYRKKNRLWIDPFGNVPNTITTWRPYILNYIDFKGCFEIRTTTNAFAEFTNKQIKKAYKLGNGYTLEVLRAKVVFGGVLVRRRPPHPLDDKSPRKKRRRIGEEIRNQGNPNANVARMKRAQEETDKTKGLLPSPQEAPGWVERCGQ